MALVKTGEGEWNSLEAYRSFLFVSAYDNALKTYRGYLDAFRAPFDGGPGGVLCSFDAWLGTKFGSIGLLVSDSGGSSSALNLPCGDDFVLSWRPGPEGTACVGAGGGKREVVGGVVLGECRDDTVGESRGVSRGDEPARVESGNGGAGPGPRTWANRAKRAAAKQRKLRKQAAARAESSAKEKEAVKKAVPDADKSHTTPEWRRGAGPARGFFAECDEEVRKELRESRAKLLIAENKRRTALAEANLKKLNSPMAAVEEAMRAVAIADKLAKLEGDRRVIGWAETVTASYLDSVSGGSTGSSGSRTSGTKPTSVSISSSISQAYEKRKAVYGLKVMKSNVVESWLLKHGYISEQRLVNERARLKRQLTAEQAARMFNLRTNDAHELLDLELVAARDVRCYENEVWG